MCACSWVVVEGKGDTVELLLVQGLTGSLGGGGEDSIVKRRREFL
jgi:hypothetical protein